MGGVIVRDFLKLEPAVSRTGVVCLWERGGAYTNSGSAQCIADKGGFPKVALYRVTRGNRACLNHALIPVIAGDLICQSQLWHGELSYSLYRITKATTEEVVAEPIQNKDRYKALVNACVNKCKAYHCREAMYIK